MNVLLLDFGGNLVYKIYQHVQHIKDSLSKFERTVNEVRNF